MSAAGSLSSLSDGSSARSSRRRHGPVRSRRLAVVAVAVVALLPLAGCAAGIKAETSRERPTIDGVGGALGTLSVRNAYVGGPG